MNPLQRTLIEKAGNDKDGRRDACESVGQALRAPVPPFVNKVHQGPPSTPPARNLSHSYRGSMRVSAEVEKFVSERCVCAASTNLLRCVAKSSRL